MQSIYFNPGSTIAGKSTVLLRVMIVEEKSGQIIANPEFYQHANAWGAAYSFGATNNAMLNRVSELALQYISDNYKSAVGGKTGVEK